MPTQTVIFRLEVEDVGLATRIERTRQNIRELNAEIRKNPGPERFAELSGQLSKNRRELGELVKEQRALNREFAQLKVPKDSLAGLRLEYSKLAREVANLSAAERNSAFGKQLIKNAAGVKKEIDKVEQSMGRFTGNVGNYQSALNGLGRAFAALGIGATLNEIIGANTKISDSIADVAKTANLTINEAQRLADALEFRDTRTSLADQLQIAAIGGQLGIVQDQLEGFTSSVDVLNVALGDQFGNVENITRTISGLRNVLTDFRTEDTAQDLLRLGNALNYLETQGPATATSIADFVGRIGGAAIPLGVTTDKVFGLSTALSELAIEPERGATAVSQLLLQISRAPDVFAKALNIPVEDFVQLATTDLVGALALVAQKTQEGSANNVEFAQTLEELGINRQSAVEVLGKLGGNVDLLTKRVEASSQALQSTDSVYQEFEKKNNNAAAAVDKLQNAVIKLVASEGAQDAIEAVAKAATNLIEVFSETLNLISDNAEEFAVLGAAIFAMTNPTALAASAFLRLQATTNLATIAGIRQTAATVGQTVATGAATVATNVLNAAQRAMPLLLLVAGIYAVVKAIQVYNAGFTAAERASRAVADAQEEIAQSSGKEVAALTASIGVLQEATSSTEARAAAIRQLTEAYPEYLKGIDLEKQNAAQLAVIQRELTDTVIRGAAARAKANAQAKVSEKIVEKELEIARLKKAEEEGRFTLQDRAFIIGNEERGLANLRKELEAVGKEFDKVFKLDRPQESSVLTIVDPKILKQSVDLTKKTIAELRALNTDAANDEIKRRQALVNSLSDTDDKANKRREKAADDEAKRTKEQAERIADIQRSVRDLTLTDEEGFTRDLQELENKRADALSANAARFEKLRESIRERTGVAAPNSTAGVRKLANAQPADITEADLIDKETEAINGAFDRQRAELKAQREKTQQQQTAELEALLAEVNKIAAENEVTVAVGAQADISGSFQKQRDALKANLEERTRILREQLIAGEITQKQFNEQEAANQIEHDNRLLQLESDYATRVGEIAGQVRDIKVQAARETLTAELKAIEERRKAEVDKIQQSGGTSGGGGNVTDRIAAVNAQAAEQAKAAELAFGDTVKAVTSDAEQAQLDAIDRVNLARDATHQGELQRIADEERARQQVRDAAIQTAQSIAGSLIEIQRNRIQEETDTEIEELEKTYKKKIDAAKGNQALQDKLQAELEAKREEIQKKAAKRQQQLAIIEALINTAVAVTKALGSAPPPFNFVLAALSLAAGVAQVAAIKSQPLAKGGYAKNKNSADYPLEVWEALPEVSGGGYTGNGLNYRDATGKRVAGRLSVSRAVIHEGEYVNPAWQVSQDPEVFGAMEAARRSGRRVSDYVQVRPFAAGGSTLPILSARPFAAGGLSNPVIGLPNANELRTQTIQVQAQAAFTNDQVAALGSVLAGEISRQVRNAMAAGLDDNNRLNERLASLEDQRNL